MPTKVAPQQHTALKKQKVNASRVKVQTPSQLAASLRQPNKRISMDDVPSPKKVAKKGGKSKKGAPASCDKVFVQPVVSGSGGFGSARTAMLHRRVRSTLNETGCYHCPSARCHCERVSEILAHSYGRTDGKRKIEVAGKKELCAKSFLPSFVAWMVELLQLTPDDTFVDLGSGNGSVCYQVAALVPGIKVIGVELFAPNAQVSRDAWPVAKPLLQEMVNEEGRNGKGRHSGKKVEDVEIITGRLEDFISSERFAALSEGGKVAVWATNMLMPYYVTHHMAERFRRLPAGCRIMCMDPDCYPHQRDVHRSRDPEAFELFDMTDIRWASGMVEWCKDEGTVFRHVRTAVEHPLGSILPQ